MMEEDDLLKMDVDYVKNNKETTEDEFSSPQSPLEADHTYVSSPVMVPKVRQSCSSSGLSSCSSSLESKPTDFVANIYQEIIRPVSVKLEDCLLQVGDLKTMTCSDMNIPYCDTFMVDRMMFQRCEQ